MYRIQGAGSARLWSMDRASVEQRFTHALAALIEHVKGDRSILAAVLCGSLSHDTVWAKSDVDLVLSRRRRSQAARRSA